MICGACGTENRPDRRFCRACGGSLVAACPSCGAVNDPEDRFCGSCGTPIGATPSPGVAGPGFRPATAPRPLSVGPPSVQPTSSSGIPAVAERRLVTVLFADLVGFTTIAEGRDPEETRELLGRYFDLATDVIGRYGGSIEKFIGDAVMAVWGAPVAREDDAERAVRAGLELVDAIRSLGPGIQARAGCLTGEAAVTVGAVNQGMVAGDLVNTAARLQSAAAPGTVLVGESTRRATAAAIAYEAAGDQSLKGKAVPVPAFRAVRVVAEVGGRNRSEGLEAPFVGREEELRQLKDLFHATGRERRTRLVSIVGPAGIGKSRLAWEFSKYTDGVVETVWWHSGRSPAYGSGISFWALGEMMRGRCGLREGEDDATSRQKIRETVALFVTDEDERRWIEMGLRALLGVGEGPQGGPEELFSAWRTFFERIAEQGTTALVFEDLHWADSGTLDFIDHLLDWTRGLPIFIVTLARPELLERRPDWGAGKRHFTSVFLEPLSDADMRTLLGGLVPGLPASAAAAIVARADGMPLYAVETVRMLVSQGRLVERDGAYAPVGEIESLDVPETLTALIAARLDGVGPADRSLIQDAAVLGQSFSLSALEAVSGVPRMELEPRLGALVRRELLVRQSDPRSPERGQYAFVQSLIREVAYNALARPERRNRHLAAARYFESVGGEELAGALAAQYLAAFRASPAGPEADALATQARVSLRAAAERAASLGATRQAVDFLRQALEVTTDPLEEADLLERAATQAGIASIAEADAFAERAVALRRAAGDRAAMARATYIRARALLDLREIDAALPLLQAATTEFADMPDDPSVIGLAGQLARVLMQQERNEEALAACEVALLAAEHADLLPVIADTLITRGTALSGLYRYREGGAVLRAGIALAEEAGLGTTALRGLNNLVSGWGDIDPRMALDAARQGISTARRLGHASLEGTLTIGLCGAALYTGDWQEALDGWETMVAAQRGSSALLTLGVLIAMIEVPMGSGRLPAHEEATKALLERRDDLSRSQVHDYEAHLALQEGRWSDAVAAADASNRLASFPGIVLVAMRAALLGGDLATLRREAATFDALGAHGAALGAQRAALGAGLAAMEGDRDGALRAYRAALTDLRAMGVRWLLALTALEMLTVLPDEPEALEAALEGRAIMAEIGARPMLARIEAAIAAVDAASGVAST